MKSSQHQTQTDDRIVVGAYAYLTRRIRIDTQDILAVRRHDLGATVVTSRGAVTVLDDYDQLVAELYGIQPAQEVGK